MINEEIDFDSLEFAAALEQSQKPPVVAAPAAGAADTHQDTDVITAPAKPADATVKTDANAPAVNYDEYLSTKSGGLFKSEADWLASLDKIKNYDSVETRLRDTEAKIPQFKNEEQQRFFEEWVNANEDWEGKIKSYWAEKDKPYATMSAVDIMREALKKENPAWDDRRVELKLRKDYGTNLEKIDTSGLDPEDDKEELRQAEQHNKEVERNLELLEADAFDQRVKLIDAQKQISRPEIKKTEPTNAQPQLTEAEIAENKKQWQQGIKEAVQGLPAIKADTDYKGVEYVSTDDDKAALEGVMTDLNLIKFFSETRGWMNADKSWNKTKIAEDVRFLTEGPKIISSIAGQVKTEAIRATMAKIKNTDGNYESPDGPKTFATLEDAAWDALEKKRKAVRNEEWEEQD